MNTQLSIAGLAQEILRKHDRNKDGAVNVGAFSDGLWGNVRVATDEIAKVDEQAVSWGSNGGNTVVVHRRDEFLASADLTGDGKVSRTELNAKLRSFDTNGNGKLDTDAGFWGFLPGMKSEVERFREEFDKLTKQWTFR